MNFISSTLFLFIFIQLNAQEWKLVYHNDEEGNKVEGSLESFKNAVKQGKEVRIAWGYQHPTEQKVSVHHLADAAFLTIQSDSIIYAQIRPIYGQTPNFETYQITLKENLEWIFIGGTNGKMDTMMRNMITGEIISHNLKKSHFKWFIKD